MNNYDFQFGSWRLKYAPSPYDVLLIFICFTAPYNFNIDGDEQPRVVGGIDYVEAPPGGMCWYLF